VLSNIVVLRLILFRLYYFVLELYIKAGNCKKPGAKQVQLSLQFYSTIKYFIFDRPVNCWSCCKLCVTEKAGRVLTLFLAVGSWQIGQVLTLLLAVSLQASQINEMFINQHPCSRTASGRSNRVIQTDFIGQSPGWDVYVYSTGKETWSFISVLIRYRHRSAGGNK
jgi:hypothetical protein